MCVCVCVCVWDACPFAGTDVLPKLVTASLVGVVIVTPLTSLYLSRLGHPKEVCVRVLSSTPCPCSLAYTQWGKQSFQHAACPCDSLACILTNILLQLGPRRVHAIPGSSALPAEELASCKSGQACTNLCMPLRSVSTAGVFVGSRCTLITCQSQLSYPVSTSARRSPCILAPRHKPPCPLHLVPSC